MDFSVCEKLISAERKMTRTKAIEKLIGEFIKLE
jgi:hypothetical protein